MLQDLRNFTVQIRTPDHSTIVGTGVAVSNDGQIVTCAHVVSAALNVKRRPLVGDVVYRRGTRHGLAFPRQALHAAELSLIHPGTHQRVTWQSPLPRDMKKLVEQLRND